MPDPDPASPSGDFAIGPRSRPRISTPFRAGDSLVVSCRFRLTVFVIRNHDAPQCDISYVYQR